MASQVTLRVDPQAIMRLGAGPTGPVFRYIVTLGAKVETRAKQNVSGQMVRVDKGNLRSSIGTTVVVQGTVVRATVTAAARYALVVHEGSKPHDIVPKHARVLAWKGPTGPRFAKRVHHPGTRARPYLRDALNVVRT